MEIYKRKRKSENIFGSFTEGIKNGRLLNQSIDELNEIKEINNPDDINITEDRRISYYQYLFFYLLVFLIFIVLLLRVGYLQIIKGDYFLSLAEGNRIRTKVVYAPRGIIYDRNKNILAKNVPNFEAKIIPQDFPQDKKKREEIINQLANFIHKDSQEITQKLKENKNKDQLEPLLIKDNLTQEEALLLELKSKELPGIILEKNPRREYTEGSSFAHILGYTGRVDENFLKTHKDYALNDYVGKNGLELFYEKELKGKNGQKQFEVDAAGNLIKEISSVDYKIGNSLVLSIDSNLQKEVNAALSEGLKNAGVKRGAVVAINPQNGEILSMVSLPEYDNNRFAQGISSQDYNSLINDENQPLFNRCISGQYLIGSTVKPIVAAGGLQEGVIDSKTTVTCTGAIEVPNEYNPSIIYVFPCWLRSGHGTLNVIDGIAQSCNVFFYTVGGGYKNIKGLGADRLAKYMNLFGLGDKTGIDLPDENKGLVPTPGWKEAAKAEPWYQGDTYNMSIGQGDVLATPIQLANYTACFANGGTLFQPFLVKQIINSEGKVIKENKSIIKRQGFISPENIEIVREGMRTTVTRGTARMLSSLPFPVAGKTGTAEIIRGGKKHAWFICFAPYDNPQIALSVLIEEGGEGAEYAVPVAKRILDYYFKNKL